MESTQLITFVIDKNLDIANHIIALNSYRRNKERGFKQYKNDSIENLLNFKSEEEIKVEIEKSIEQYYKKETTLISLVNDVNEEWIKIEKAFISKLEKIHKFTFPNNPIKGVLSTASRFGYNTDDGWFATDMLRNKFLCIDTATHELMHFIFHKYYDQICIKNGLSKDQMWDIKESFTVLLNLEFIEFRFQLDKGYSPHMELREIIRHSWIKCHDFDKALEEAIKFIKKVI